MERHVESPDDVLVARARGGCRDSYGELAERHAQGVYDFLRRRAGSREDAEELCQESLLRAWRKLDTFQDKGRFPTWLLAIARSVAAERARRPRVHATRDADVEPIDATDRAGEVDARDERVNLWDTARLVLDDDQHSALWLSYAEDKSAAEIGRILGRSPLAVRLLLFRARATLRRHLERRAARAERVDPRRLRPSLETSR